MMGWLVKDNRIRFINLTFLTVFLSLSIALFTKNAPVRTMGIENQQIIILTLTQCVMMLTWGIALIFETIDLLSKWIKPIHINDRFKYIQVYSSIYIIQTFINQLNIKKHHMVMRC
jgi:hypothetical protein